jgi:FkbM family methyltransferase
MRSWSGLGNRIANAFSLKTILRSLYLLDFAKRVRSVVWKLQDSWLLRIHPKGSFVRASNRSVVYVDFRNPNYRWYYGSNLFLEQEHLAFLEQLNLKKPGVIVDIGAHWGIFPAMLEADYKRFPSISHVVCIEPDPENIPILRKTISRIKNFKVTIIESAIGESDSTISAYRDGGACLQTYSNRRDDGDLKVSVRKLETILADIGICSDEVTHIKIDIDGFEPSFFFGSRGWLQRVSPFVMAEYWAKGLEKHPRYSIQDYYRLLQEDYYVLACNYPAGTYSVLGEDDFQRLNQLTQQAVANLLLIPKGSMSMDLVKRTFSC